MRMQDEGGEASSGLFSGPAAQRASSAAPHTRPHPFRLSASNTPAVHAAALTTDQRQLMELKARKREEAAHRRRQLARLVTAPAAYGGGHGGSGAATHGSPQRAPTKVKPFNLMSVALHEQEVAAREAAARVRIDTLQSMPPGEPMSTATRAACRYSDNRGPGTFTLVCKGRYIDTAALHSSLVSCLSTKGTNGIWAVAERGGAGTQRDTLPRPPLRPQPLPPHRLAPRVA